MPPPRGRAALVRGTGAGEGQPGARGENRAGDVSSQRGAALSCKRSGTGCLMTSHQLARGAEVFPSRLSRAKINKTRRETALAPRRSREIGRGTTERPPQPGVSVGSSWERGSLLEILLQGSEKGFFGADPPLWKSHLCEMGLKTRSRSWAGSAGLRKGPEICSCRPFVTGFKSDKHPWDPSAPPGADSQFEETDSQFKETDSQFN